MQGVPRMERAPGVGLRVVAAAAPHDPPRVRLRSICPLPRAARAGSMPPSLRAKAAAGAYRLLLVFRRIDHIGVAVEQMEPTLAFYRDVFQLPVAHREVVEEQGVEAVLLDIGENHVELLAPLGAQTPVGRFLSRNGPGLHHRRLSGRGHRRCAGGAQAGGMAMIDEQPRVGIRGSRVASCIPGEPVGC